MLETSNTTTKRRRPVQHSGAVDLPSVAACIQDPQTGRHPKSAGGHGQVCPACWPMSYADRDGRHRADHSDHATASSLVSR